MSHLDISMNPAIPALNQDVQSTRDSNADCTVGVTHGRQVLINAQTGHQVGGGSDLSRHLTNQKLTGRVTAPQYH